MLGDWTEAVKSPLEKETSCGTFEDALRAMEPLKVTHLIRTTIKVTGADENELSVTGEEKWDIFFNVRESYLERTFLFFENNTTEEQELSEKALLESRSGPGSTSQRQFVASPPASIAAYRWMCTKRYVAG